MRAITVYLQVAIEYSDWHTSYNTHWHTFNAVYWQHNLLAHPFNTRLLLHCLILTRLTVDLLSHSSPCWSVCIFCSTRHCHREPSPRSTHLIKLFYPHILIKPPFNLSYPYLLTTMHADTVIVIPLLARMMGYEQTQHAKDYDIKKVFTPFLPSHCR